MSDNKNQNAVSKLVFTFVFIFTASLLIVVFYIPSSTYQRDMEKEVKSISKLVTTEQWYEITEETKRRYQSAYVDSGIHGQVKSTLTPKGDYKIKKVLEKKALKDLLEQAINNITIMAYQISYRTTIFVYWFYLLIPFFIAVLYDGYTKRQIRMYEPDQISIKASSFWNKSMFYLFALAFIYLVLPNIIGEYIAWLPLAALGLVALGLKSIIQNFMKIK